MSTNGPRKKRSDIGKKRRAYDSKLRSMFADNRVLKEQQRLIANMEEREMNPGRPRSERRAEARQRLIERLVGVARRCPQCGVGPLLESRRWVVRRSIIQPRCVCVSCHRASPFGD